MKVKQLHTQQRHKVLLFLILAFFIVPLTVFAEDTTPSLGGSGDRTYHVWVAGVQIDSNNAGDVLGDGTISFDPSTNTLTLKDAAVMNEGGAGIYSEGIDLVVKGIDTEAEGSNTIVAKDVIVTGKDEDGLDYSEIAEYGHGIYVEGGALTIIGVLGDITTESSGIYADQGVTISGTVGNIQATSDAELTSNPCGIFSFFSGIVVDGTVGNITAEGEGISGADDITITGTVGDITADYGIYITGGDITIKGTKINIIARTTGIDLYGDEDFDESGTLVQTVGGYITICDGAQVSIVADSCGISAHTGITIRDAVAYMAVEAGDGIYIYRGDLVVLDSRIAVEAGVAGIYLYDGSAIFDCTKAVVSKTGPWVDGTTVEITAGDEAIFVYNELKVHEKLTISLPENGKVQEKTVTDSEEGDYTFQTIVNGNDKIAKEVKIEPLSYYVTIRGLSYGMKVCVPAGQSVNDAYCEMYKVEDFSQILNTDKTGYNFGGWYTDEACTAGNAYSFADAVNSDNTIYAKWTPITDNPQTGDSSNVQFLVFLGLISVLGIVATVVCIRKQKI